MKILNLSYFVGVALASSSLAAQAQLINLADQADGSSANVGYMSGSAVLGTTPSNSTDYWNTFDLRSVSNDTPLKDANDQSTSVTLSVSSFEGENWSGPDSTGGLAPALLENFAYEFALDGGKSALDFSGLSANTAYTLVLYTLNDGSNADTTYTVNGVTSTLIQTGHSTYTSTPTTSLVDPGTVYSGNYIELTGTSDGSGDLNIALGLAPSNTSNGGVLSYLAFTGLQLEAAPEPTTLALMLAGVAGLIFLVRRKPNQFGLGR